jgi:plastocyanin
MSRDEPGARNPTEPDSPERPKGAVARPTAASLDAQRTRRAFLRAAVVGSVAMTGASAAAMAPWRPQILGSVKPAFAAASPVPTGTPTATPTKTPTPPPPAAVTISRLAFSPATLTIPRGTTVTWTNQDPTPHTSTCDTNVWDSHAISGSGGTFSFTFDVAPGTYNYHCSIHTFMHGSITVT